MRPSGTIVGVYICLHYLHYGLDDTIRSRARSLREAATLQPLQVGLVVAGCTAARERLNPHTTSDAMYLPRCTGNEAARDAQLGLTVGEAGER